MSVAFSANKRSVAKGFLAGISTLSLAVGMAHVATPAHAVDPTAFYWLSLGYGSPSAWYADNGVDMSGTITKYPASGFPYDRWIVEWTSGGNAGPGHDGGHGGAINSQLYGTYVSGKLAHNNPPLSIEWGPYQTKHLSDGRFHTVDVTPFAFFFSEGGVGGGDINNRGPGGNGGNVTVTVEGSVTTNDDKYAGVWIASAGGNSGWGGSSKDRGNYLNSGKSKAGDVSGSVAAGASITTNGSDAPALIVESIGGDGGSISGGAGEDYRWSQTGANGGKVTVTNYGTITTAHSTGIVAQSFAGKGTVQAESGKKAHGGGWGGHGGNVAVYQAGAIQTKGDNGYGIAAYSVGGLGGAGDLYVKKGDGGNGGTSGNGGTVYVYNQVVNGKMPTIDTYGNGAHAIYAVSLGGGLVDGFYHPHQGEVPADGGKGGRHGHGGNGSSGGVAGNVHVQNEGHIETRGNDAAGIHAQSLGGLGGDGGSDTRTGLFFALALGGNGGAGGKALDILIDGNYVGQSITTHGESSPAIFAQSAGGGGGSGGFAKANSYGAIISVSVAVGGSGGWGGNAGPINIWNTNTIRTEGMNSPGVFAQSIGGGGGRAGSAKSGATAISGGDIPSIAVAVSVGGSGGAAGNGEDVDIVNRAPITTFGVNSYGIYAQSIGGGGGDAGGALSHVLSASQIPLGASVGVGGSGGAAGHGGKITIETHTGTIATSGNGAHGVFVQTIGGGGGNGGDATSRADMYGFGDSSGAGLTFTFGGDGSGGGDGGEVDVTTGMEAGSLITTGGDSAYGIFAQSIGGGGGTGGQAESAAGTGVSFGDTITDWMDAMPLASVASVQLNIGGQSGKGGAGGAVNITNQANGTIYTKGSNSHGIFAQSIGGGGGNGGDFAAGGKSNAQKDLKVNIGGAGGEGGHSGHVIVNNSGAIITEGDGAHGIFAQSVGGGGGNGGQLSVAKHTVPDYGGQFVSQLKKIVGYDIFKEWADKNGYTDDYEMLSKIAKIVQDTGIADTFEEQFKEQLLEKLKLSDLAKSYQELTKKYSDKIESKEKRSITVNVGVGGTGGNGGYSWGTEIHNSGSIHTKGNIAHGIYAQSIGGGGGTGGAGGSNISDGNTVTLNVGVGGSGGAASDGGTVIFSNAGDIRTDGDVSYGIFTQSVGGGGGLAAGAASAETEKFSATFNVGSSGGGGGHGEWISLYNSGNITTSGRESHAIFAQSIGGGGGAAAANVGNDEDLTDDEKSQIDKKLDVTDKIAIIMGAAGTRVLNPGSDSAKEHAKSLKELALKEASFTVNLGGSGGSGGGGGDVTVSHAGGQITTSGEASIGILLQSIGGGGGLFGKTGEFNIGDTYKLTLGGQKNDSGKTGKGGDGGQAILKLAENAYAYITTSGDGAHAVLAQSIGGGGGYLGRVPRTSEFVSSENTSGNGGHVTIEMGNASNHALINTTGRGAHGIFAQSIGGGGGAWTNVDDYYTLDPGQQGSSRTNANGNGGAIDINYRGSIHATGQYAYAVLAQSGKQTTKGTIDPNSTGGRIQITLDGGNFVGGSSAIRIDGGAKGSDDSNKNIITIGSGANVHALSNTAILAYAGGSELVKLYGKMSGDVILTDNPTSTTEYNNLQVLSNGNQHGYYTSRAGTGTVSVGRGWLNVWGKGSTLDVGGINSLSTLNVTDNMDVRGGTLLVDVNATTAGVISHDAINVSGQLYLETEGGPAKPSGSKTQIVPNVMTGLLKRDYQIFNKAPDAATRAIDVVANTGSPITWASTNNGQSITPKADFVGSASSQHISLTAGQTQMLTNLQTVWDDPKQTSLANLFGIAAREIHSSAQYAEAINRLDPSQYSSTAAAETNGAKVSLKTPLSCPVFIDAGVTLGETQCVWGRISGAFAKNKSSDGYKQDEFSYRIGAQWEIAPDWFLGVSGSYFSSELDSHSGHLTSRGKGGNVAAALKRQMGPWLFAVSGHFGYGSYDTSHNIKVGNQNWFSEGNSDVWTGALGFRASYELALGNFYIRPAVDLDVVHTYVPSFVSQGNFPYAYHFGAMKEWTLSASPFVEVGTRIDISEKTWLRPFASIGGTFLHDGDLDRKVSFGHGAPRFTATHAMDQHYLDLGAGLQLFSNDQLELRAEYKAKIGENYTRHEASGRMSIKF